MKSGDREAAMRVCAKAEDGYATIARFLPVVNNPGHRNHITQRLTEQILRREFPDGLENELERTFRKVRTIYDQVLDKA